MPSKAHPLSLPWGYPRAMTVREPTLKMRVEILEAQVEDYRWALDRLVELVGERNPAAAAAIVDRLREENLVRQARKTRAANGM